MIKTYPEQNVVPSERVEAIINGSVPGSVYEIDLVGAYAAQFTPQYNHRRLDEAPAFYTQYNEYGQRVQNVSSEQYRAIANTGTRDYWRLDDQGVQDFTSIAFHTTISEIPASYQDLFMSVAKEPGGIETLRQEAIDRLALDHDIRLVEEAEQVTTEIPMVRNSYFEKAPAVAPDPVSDVEVITYELLDGRTAAANLTTSTDFAAREKPSLGELLAEVVAERRLVDDPVYGTTSAVKMENGKAKGYTSGANNNYGKLPKRNAEQQPVFVKLRAKLAAGAAVLASLIPIPQEKRGSHAKVGRHRYAG